MVEEDLGNLVAEEEIVRGNIAAFETSTLSLEFAG
jgi:hypothetical protein